MLQKGDRGESKELIGTSRRKCQEKWQGVEEPEVNKQEKTKEKLFSEENI